MFFDINSLKHLATLGLCWTFCNRLQVVVFPADLARFRGGHIGCLAGVLGWPFWGCLAGVPHRLKCLSLVICYSWDHAGHLATSYK